MPKELFCVALGRLEWNDYDEPALTDKQVRIRSEFASAKHGTEMAAYKGYALDRGRFDMTCRVWVRGGKDPGFSYPQLMGNMTVGTVIEAGPDVKDLAVGRRVLAYGGFRRTHVRDEDECRIIPDELSWKSAVCLDPARFALAAVRDGNLRVGDAAAIFGMGAIGLMAVQIAVVCGASPVIAVDPLANRRSAAESLGADVALDPTACDAGLEIKKLTGGRGADVAIEYSGARRALQDALRCAAFGGNVVAGAFPPPYDAGLDFGTEAHRNIVNIIFSRACSEPNRDHPRWSDERICDVCFALLAKGRIAGERIVTPVVAFDDLLGEYPKIATDPGASMKLGVAY